QSQVWKSVGYKRARCRDYSIVRAPAWRRHQRDPQSPLSQWRRPCTGSGGAGAGHPCRQCAAMTARFETLRRLRLGDLKRLFRHRYGPTLFDDDAGRDDLFELLLPVSLRGKSAGKVMRNVIETWAPWMEAAEAYILLQRIEIMPLALRNRT